jgi:hypothetical protein
VPDQMADIPTWLGFEQQFLVYEWERKDPVAWNPSLASQNTVSTDPWVQMAPLSPIDFEADSYSSLLQTDPPPILPTHLMALYRAITSFILFAE